MKAVIQTGGKQYIVSEGDTLDIDLVKIEKTTSFTPLLIIDGDKTVVGTPEVENAKVEAEIVEQEIKADKATAIRYKAKKRVRKVRGHRQLHTKIKIKKITQKSK